MFQTWPDQGPAAIFLADDVSAPPLCFALWVTPGPLKSTAGSLGLPLDAARLGFIPSLGA